MAPARTSPAGSQLFMLHAQRVMKVYPIVESELNTITTMNWLSSLGFSIGGLFLGIVLNIWIGSSFYTELVPEAKIMVHLVAPISLGLSIIFFGISILAVIFRGSTWRAVVRSANMEPNGNR